MLGFVHVDLDYFIHTCMPCNVAFYFGTFYTRGFLFDLYACLLHLIPPLTSLNAIREIPQVIVTSIAEGNLNPSTKEAFDKLEHSGLPLDPIVLKSNRQQLKVQVSAAFTQESSFKVFGSHNARENSTGKSCDLWKDLYQIRS